MTYRLFALLLLFALSAAAQIDNGVDNRARSVTVRVLFPGTATCDPQSRVSLMSATGVPLGESSLRGDCRAEFSGVPRGTYRLLISGHGGSDASSEKFEVNAEETQDLDVRINSPATPGSQAGSGPGGALIAAAQLKVPKEAKKEFARANDLMAAENWPKAMERLNHAITIYPEFVDAYNNLGVVYARMGDRAHERDVLLRAISLDDHYAPAYANLARADIAEHNLANAEMLLDKATAIDPTDAITLVLLASVELRTQHFDRVIETCSRAHATKQPQHTMAHYIAALAYEHLNRLPDAMAELRAFLNEEADGPQAAAARKEMAALRAVMR